jgi:hypothetical protein
MYTHPHIEHAQTTYPINRESEPREREEYVYGCVPSPSWHLITSFQGYLGCSETLEKLENNSHKHIPNENTSVFSLMRCFISSFRRSSGAFATNQIKIKSQHKITSHSRRGLFLSVLIYMIEIIEKRYRITICSTVKITEFFYHSTEPKVCNFHRFLIGKLSKREKEKLSFNSHLQTKKANE